METRILVPLDGSPLAEQALSCAVTLGRGLSAELVLFRAVSIPAGARRHLDAAAMDEGDLLERLNGEADEYLHEVADRARLAGLSVQTVVQHGPAPEAIVDYAEQMDIWQIVMATHGDHVPLPDANPYQLQARWVAPLCRMDRSSHGTGSGVGSENWELGLCSSSRGACRRTGTSRALIWDLRSPLPGHSD